MLKDCIYCSLKFSGYLNGWQVIEFESQDVVPKKTGRVDEKFEK
jgi:hypothetical protein